MLIEISEFKIVLMDHWNTVGQKVAVKFIKNDCDLIGKKNRRESIASELNAVGIKNEHVVQILEVSFINCYSIFKERTRCADSRGEICHLIVIVFNLINSLLVSRWSTKMIRKSCLIFRKESGPRMKTTKVRLPFIP